MQQFIAFVCYCDHITATIRPQTYVYDDNDNDNDYDYYIYYYQVNSTSYPQRDGK